MKFEYDVNKSKINKETHGIDFEETKGLWESDYVIVKNNFLSQEQGK